MYLYTGQLSIKFWLFLIIFMWSSNTYLSIIKQKSVFVGASVITGHKYNDLIITSHEKKILDLFRERVAKKLPETYMKTDFYLIRWLKANTLNVKEAEHMLFENIQWREKNNISKINFEDFSDISEDNFATTNTHDKSSRPIGTVNLGTWDIRGTVVQGKLPRLSRYVDRVLETLVQQILKAQENGKEVTRALLLIDLEGFNIFQHACPSCISVFIKLLSSLQSHYPGFWEEIVLINSPPIFRLVLDGVGGIMSSEVRHALKLFGNNKEMWMAYLDARIERKQRYQNFGGIKDSNNI